MKSTTTSKLFATSFAMMLLATLNPQLATFAQGSLTPPDPPAPMMKTLAQIEPRTPISSLPHLIIRSGSYYLTTNLTGGVGSGITISNSNVTLDLMGFELVGGIGGVGVFVGGTRTNICIRNGTIRSWWGWGVDADTAHNSVLKDLRASENGLNTSVGGLRIGAGSRVTDCTARSNGGVGIYAYGSMVSGCVANYNGDKGIVADASTVSGCSTASNAEDGISGGSGSTIIGCTAEQNGRIGISAYVGSSLSGCTVSFNTGDGIQVTSYCYVAGNNCSNNGWQTGDGAGIRAELGNNRIDGNNVIGNDQGIDVDSSVNLIIRNSARGNTGGNYVIVSGNRVGTIVVPPLSGAISGNGPGAGSGATDPFANFAF